MCHTLSTTLCMARRRSDQEHRHEGREQVDLVISAPRVVAGTEVIQQGGVVVADGRIAEVFAGDAPAGGEHVTLDAGTLVPGFVDLQVNGYAGVDFAVAEPDGWSRAAEALAREGVTAFVPTLITAPIGDLLAGLGRARAVAAALADDGSAASIVAVHLEGPFLSPAYRGAHAA